MKAIIQDRYGPPDVLRLMDIDTPVLSEDEVLVRVHAAAVNIGDWHLLRGLPYIMRMVVGLLRPKREIPGLDLAGRVEAVGTNVNEFRPGDEVFGWCQGADARDETGNMVHPWDPSAVSWSATAPSRSSSRPGSAPWSQDRRPS